MKRVDWVISNWHLLIDDFSTSGAEFFDEVELAVRAREVPRVTFSRHEFKEGGFASSKRLYLRIEREHVAFDLCAAKYGTGFFFSWWLSRLGPKHAFLYVVAFIIMVIIGSRILVGLFASSSSVIAWLVVPPLVVVGLGYLVRARIIGREEHILMIPWVGWLYNKLFNPVTYYSIDTAIMFRESVRRAVNEVIDSLLTEQGLQALRDDQKTPITKHLTN